MTGTPFPLPHHFQKTDYTCGPASVRMLFGSLWGVSLVEKELADWLATDVDTGTRQRAIEGLLKRFGLSARAMHTETTLDDLRALLAKGYVLMVMYHLESETTDHYAVVKAITDEEVIMNDPWLGPDVRFSHDAFEARWVSKDPVPEHKDRWVLAVRDKALLAPQPHVTTAEVVEATGDGAASA